MRKIAIFLFMLKKPIFGQRCQLRQNVHYDSKNPQRQHLSLKCWKNFDFYHQFPCRKISWFLEKYEQHWQAQMSRLAGRAFLYYISSVRFASLFLCSGMTSHTIIYEPSNFFGYFRATYIFYVSSKFGCKLFLVICIHKENIFPVDVANIKTYIFA